MEITKWFDFLHQYPAWLKSGILLWLIFGLILLVFLFYLWPTVGNASQQVRKDIVISQTNPVNLDLPLTDISVKEIVDSVRKVPPLQQQTTAANYLGLKVEWVGYLKTAEPEYGSKNKIRIKLHVNANEIVDYSIWFSADLDKYPEFKFLHEQSKIKVRGSIVSVSVPGLNVNLDPESIIILERASK